MYEKTTFAGRWKAHSPYYEAQSLDSRGGRPLDRYAEYLSDNLAIEPDITTIDISGQSVPADDQADDNSDYGSHDSGG